MKRYPRITVYKDKSGQWRWRMVAGGRVVAESGEAYTERNKCVRAIGSVFGPVIMHQRWYAKAAGYDGFLHTQNRINVVVEGKPLPPQRFGMQVER